MAAEAAANGTAMMQFGGPSRLRRIWNVLKGNPVLVVSLAILLLVVLAAVCAPVVATHDPNRQSLADSLKGPTPEHWAGTDKGGRDVWSRTVYAGRVSLLVGFGAMIVGGLLERGRGLENFAGGCRRDVVIVLIGANGSVRGHLSPGSPIRRSCPGGGSRRVPHLLQTHPSEHRGSGDHRVHAGVQLRDSHG